MGGDLTIMSDRFGLGGNRKQGARTSVLCVALLKITQPLHEEFYGDVLVVIEQMSLRGLSGVVHERVRISCDTRNACYHISGEEIASRGRE